MTGIAITLATRADTEAVAGIEKLTGLKIARSGRAAEPEKTEPRAAEPKTAKPEKRERTRAPKPERAEDPKRERAEEPKRERPQQPKHDPIPESKIERLPVVEDIKSDWNGPLPSFLSKSAG